MPRRDLDIAVALVVFGIFAAMVGAAVGYTYEARLVPLVVGVPAVLLAAWQLRQELVRRPSDAALPAVEGHEPGSDAEGAISGASFPRWPGIFALRASIWASARDCDRRVAGIRGSDSRACKLATSCRGPV